MADTQWPRYIVFQQSKERAPHEYAGSVHAPDAELALLNARDVFVRRPECISLWVVRADKIFSKTLEELELDSSWLDTLEASDTANESYYVCKKIGHKGVSQVVGEVTAATAQHALKAALNDYPTPQPLVWWVFPASAVTCSAIEDNETFFGHARDKIAYRDQSEFHTVAWLKQIKGRVQEEIEDETGN